MRAARCLLLLLLVIPAGCGNRAAVDPLAASPGIGASVAHRADDLVIRIRVGGGLVPPTDMVARVPLVSVYGDGRLVTAGPVQDIYPGPALPNIRVQHLTAGQVAGYVARARAGVATITDFGQPQVLDASSTTFTVEGQTVTVVALDLDDGVLTKKQRDARKALQGLQAALLDAAGGAASTPYVATRIAAVATPWTDPQPGTLPSPPPAVAWPGPDLPGDTGHAYGCVVAPAGTVRPAAAKANANTPWTSGGARWRVELRPLLPDESTCADLAR